MNQTMRFVVVLAVAAAVSAMIFTAKVGCAGEEWSRGHSDGDEFELKTLAQVQSMLQHQTKDVVELGAASIIIEVNDTDGDAGFQVFLDGDGWRNVRVFDPDGRKILAAVSASGIREIGGATELFLETAEPEYEDDEGRQELIELLPEGEYFFLARTNGFRWATGTAALTHDVPAGPEIVMPVPPENEDECSVDVSWDSALIRWDPVQETITGEGDINVVRYQIIVVDEEAEPKRVFSAVLPAENTEIMVPAEFLEPGAEYSFEVLAIEESGNQTISESCFETDE